MQTFKKNMVAITSAIPGEVMKALGATNVKAVSPRTLQFDCTPKADGTNRVKVTVEDGVFMVRGFRIDETDIRYGIHQESLAKALQQLGSEVKC